MLRVFLQIPMISEKFEFDFNFKLPYNKATKGLKDWKSKDKKLKLYFFS